MKSVCTTGSVHLVQSSLKQSHMKPAMDNYRLIDDFSQSNVRSSGNRSQKLKVLWPNILRHFSKNQFWQIQGTDSESAMLAHIGDVIRYKIYGQSNKFIRCLPGQLQVLKM